MRINSSGNVGIGLSPSFRLDIGSAGGTTGTGFHMINTSALAVNNKIFQTYTFNSGEHGQFGMIEMSTSNYGLSDFYWNTWDGSSFLERMRLTYNGKVGIGTSSPVSDLNVYRNVNGALEITASNPNTTASGSAYAGFIAKNSSKSLSMFIEGTNVVSGGLYAADAGILTCDGTYGISLFSSSSNSNATLRFGTNGNETARFDINGNYGIGITNPTYKLQVNGQPAANGYTQFTNYSDARLKTNVAAVDSSLAKIMKLRPVQFNFNSTYLDIYKDSTSLNILQKGFVAQEVKVIFPEMVGTCNIKGTEYFDLNLSNLQVYLVKAMQEQQKMIQAQDSTIAAQSSRINDLQIQITNCCNKPQGLKTSSSSNNSLGSPNKIIGSDLNNVDSNTFSDGSSPMLFQNIPNPFSRQTNIQYFIPTKTQNATIMVFDLQGKLIKTITVTNFGNGSVTISGNELSAGMFVYSLIIDGKEIDTKRMILTE
ncbi:MAG: tail fiber domain-containing protein [Bacteroidetes bacterium]|nr:tail fiber domain-containing protein [Bacteroidota bacterium]